jgi:hypothetical protein
MKGKGRYQVWLSLGITCFFVILPWAGYGASLTIGDTVSVNGDLTVSGSISEGGSGAVSKTPLQIALLKWYGASQVAAFAVGDYPYAIAFDGANIWVANALSDTVSKL